MHSPEGPPVTGADIAVDLTSELRWFFDGPLPDDVDAWFTHEGSTGLRETRRDTYRLDGEVDIGLKRRYGTILELKLRQGQPQPFRRRNLDGRLEVWRRWSPADGVVILTPNTIWVDVDKTVVKRRFAPDGQPVELTEQTRQMVGAGCDAEIADVTVRGRRAWTIALAAFGPDSDRHRSLAAAWDALVDVRPLATRRALPWSNSCSYPEWMATCYHDRKPPTGERSSP